MKKNIGNIECRDFFKEHNLLRYVKEQSLLLRKAKYVEVERQELLTVILNISKIAVRQKKFGKF